MNFLSDHTFNRAAKPGRRKNGSLEIIIQTSGITLTEELRNAIVRKISRGRRYAPEAVRARVQLERQRPNRSSDQFKILVRYELSGNDAIAENKGPEPLVALDLVAEKMARLLRKRKTAMLARRIPAKKRRILPSRSMNI